MADLLRDALALAFAMAGCVYALAFAVRVGKWWDRRRCLHAREQHYRAYLKRQQQTFNSLRLAERTLRDSSKRTAPACRGRGDGE